MKKNQRLPKPILTPSTKAQKGDHDVSVSKDELLAMGRIEPEVFERAVEVLLRAFVLPPAARQASDREQRLGLALQVAGVARDLERAPEVLLGQIPLPQVVADQAEILVVRAHARVEAGPLVDPERLLQEAGGFAPLAQVLVDEPEVVEGGDHRTVAQAGV